MFRVVLAVAVLALSGPSFAQNRSGYVIIGVGTLYCADFLNASQGQQLGGYMQTTLQNVKFSSENRAYQEWAYGVIVASEAFTDKKVSEQSINTRLDAELRNHCTANPSSRFVDAVFNFIKRHAQ
jgi:hypothetical protein